ncbi:RDD family protein [Mycolicibacterium pulveris]|uniref:RDD family protein n=1 Tax=Mycolicibacterium pulveris TaxID=36813 RepID=A0A7I7UIR4_MYCPV|nr:RDD family protein [Mycolicibacterium pulveris]MCV6979554.1 RDD family protein [Mycolicibacterium pulveris]BBY81000.1 RDD family protein [Mycolicibacterium pulveris]
MTPDTDSDTTTTAEAAPQTLASWPARAGAFAIDVLVGSAVLATLALVAWTAPLRGWLWWVFTVAAALVVLVMAVNRLVLPAIRGFSLGRALFGVEVVRRSGGRAGVWRLLARDLAHLLDTAALSVGWLWPLWDRRRRTFADLLLGTEARESRSGPRDVRRFTAGVLIAAALLCVLAVTLSYVVVYRHDRAIENARAQIIEQGPRIVEQMLSYQRESLQQDFSHAQSLTTDEYRKQLIEQQQAVQDAGVTSNEYWAVSSAVVPNPPVTPTSASMLLAMQGQRGNDPNNLKFITATVRVDFEKTGGQWRVADLTVLKKPLMNQGGQ